MTATTKIPAALLEEAKQMFMEYRSVTEIAAQLNIARTSLQYYVQKSWLNERNMRKAEIFRAFSEQKKVTMTNLSEASLKIMTRALQEAAKSDTPPTLKEAQQTAMILESIDKILRLDDGKPTEISEARPTTVVELKRKLSVDPFAEIEDIEVKEIAHE